MSQPLNASGVSLSVSDEGTQGGLSIAFSQPKNTTARWKVSVRANTHEGTFSVGEFYVTPPAASSKGARVVAIASCPGAHSWDVFITLAAGSAPGDAGLGEVDLAVGPGSGALPGVVRIGERYKYYSGNAAGALNIPAGETVLGWSAFASGAGASVTIGSGSAIPLPNAGGVAGGSGGLLKGPVALTFAGANFAGYFVEVAESA